MKPSTRKTVTKAVFIVMIIALVFASFLPFLTI